MRFTTRTTGLLAAPPPILVRAAARMHRAGTQARNA
ncbi:hypothetical protein SAMN05421776_10399 [Nocardia farcinica]|uniref:Uncharacterized protein n=1 Tax=Nocardia farcinica TaxID=37329 RepID=A0A0H5PDN3_NOCFR|nr:hypothetical protein CJ469_06377 [Nocardia farcinica]PFW99186.1 hypothetical protein CJ468_06402 [Nocardia farcinica]CRY80691.1 Uncharacterised protein [Nocardia farcinica]SIT07568.1 hypothetical protein SAMN05421776_10399 [Nocardia farcinica]VFA93594.1 Uncharacterised protein [Nocardia farcinica]